MGVEINATAKPWYRGARGMAMIALVVAAAVVAAIFVVIRESSEERRSSAPNRTITDYFRANDITTTPVFRGDPGTPVISFPAPPGWSDAGPDVPPGAYGAAFFDSSVDAERPTSIVVLLSRVNGAADPAKILEYAPGELRELPGYRPVSKPVEAQMSGFDGVQLGGLYTSDGQERLIAQKTVVIPAPSGLYVLQINADGPKEEAAVIQEATAVLDDQAKIAP